MLALLLKIIDKFFRLTNGLRFLLLIRSSGGKCGWGLEACRGVAFKYPPHMGISFGNNVSLGFNTVIDVPPGAKLEIGNNVALTGYTFITATQNVTIGNDVLIGEFCSIRDSDHGIGASQLIRQQPMETRPLFIGNDVWIGRGVAVLKGTEFIGDGAVIGANAVVKSAVPENAIAVGIPAKKIGIRK